MITDCKPGDFALVSIGGRTGKIVRALQWLNGDGFADFEHAFIATDSGRVVEAYPGSARERPIGAYRHILWSTGLIPLTDTQRDAIVTSARSYIGTPYSFLDYAALTSHRLGIPTPGLKCYIQTTKHMICSQLVDQCYLEAGVHLFDDNRWPGYVTPGDLYQLLQSKR